MSILSSQKSRATPDLRPGAGARGGPLSAIGLRLDDATRRRLLELRDLNRLIREPGRQRPPAEPVPLTVLARCREESQIAQSQRKDPR